MNVIRRGHRSHKRGYQQSCQKSCCDKTDVPAGTMRCTGAITRRRRRHGWTACGSKRRDGGDTRVINASTTGMRRMSSNTTTASSTVACIVLYFFKNIIMNYCPTQSIGCMDEPKNERSKLASHVQDCMSSIMYKLTCNDEYTVQEQEDNLLVFLNLIGKVSDLQTIAKKLIEYKAKLEIEDIAEDKKEDDEEK